MAAVVVVAVALDQLRIQNHWVVVAAVDQIVLHFLSAVVAAGQNVDVTVAVDQIIRV
eukprot:CAMPEP_0194316124 /NCGR_PEP_ID=MMETSP0171-20130528/12938_1 /TAXON_ID=218684 /ORGANISM="Corethron pennatum, Strain L29A3" /LENGTH=56 /DNA_ID=CAMNT_0039072247 /DNA_START=102 /DNA_END=272 /DNA_ORIENTATION=+